MLDRVENRQAKRDRDRVDWLARVVRRSEISNPDVLANVSIRFVCIEFAFGRLGVITAQAA